MGLTTVSPGYYRPGYSNTCSNTLDARIRGWAKGFGADQLRPVTGFASTPDPVTGLRPRRVMSRRVRAGHAGVAARMSALGEPEAFRWRGRWYEVRAVLMHWVEQGRVQQGRVQQGRVEVWRVEATYRSLSSGVFDLAVAPGRAWLQRVID